MKSFLTGRYQTVVMKEGHLKLPPSPFGIPTGNNFGSLLFLTYVNDLPDRLHSELKLFADDAYGVIVKDTDCGQLQEDLQNLEQ